MSGAPSKSLVFQIFGSVYDTDVFFCEALANKIQAKVDCKVELNVQFEVDFLFKVHELTKEGPGLLHHKATHLVLRNGEVVGSSADFIKLAMAVYDIADAEVANTIVYNRLVRETSALMLKSRGRPIVNLEFADAGSRPSDAVKLGIVQIELFKEWCPQAASNFQKLCEGAKLGDDLVSYRGSPIHRLVKDGWIQCGDLVDGSGANSTAVLDATHIVPDESFALDFAFPPGGVVGFANSGAHSSGSQFFITMGPCEWMNHNYVGVGRVLHGYSVVRALNQLATSNQRPVKNITIQNCGVTQG